MTHQVENINTESRIKKKKEPNGNVGFKNAITEM